MSEVYHTELGHILPDLSIIIRRNRRARMGSFWGAVAAMFVFVFTFVRWPVLYSHFDFVSLIVLFLMAALAGLLCGHILGRWDGGRANGVYARYLRSLCEDRREMDSLKRISAEDEDAEYRELAKKLIADSKRL